MKVFVPTSAIIISFLLCFSTAQSGNAYFNWEAEKDGKETSLQKAAAEGNVAKIKQLLAKGADVNEHGRTRETPLMFAAKHNHLAAVRLLLQRKANLNITTSYGKNTALVFAAAHARTEIVKALLDAGADPSITPDLSPMGNGDALTMAQGAGKRENAELIEKALSRYEEEGQAQLAAKNGLARLLYDNPNMDLTKLNNEQQQFLKTCNKTELKIIRNVIFARYNYDFDTEWLIAYYATHFEKYKPVTKHITLTDIDKKNIGVILELEKRKNR